VEIERISRSKCFNETGAKLYAKKIACDKGYAGASLINVQYPGGLRGRCYKAKVLFYDDTTEHYQASSPIWDNRSVNEAGVNFGARLLLGPLLGGAQSETGLMNEDSIEASSMRIGVGLNVLYNPVSSVGVGLAISQSFVNATSPQTESMSYLSIFAVDVNLEAIVFRKELHSRDLHLLLQAGGNFSMLSFQDEYKDFFESEAYFTLPDDSATGFGFQIGPGARYYHGPHYFWEFLMGYRFEAPKFPKGTKAFDGKSLMIQFGLGYRI